MNDSKHFIKVIGDLDGNLSWNGYGIILLSGNTVWIEDNTCDITPKIQTAITNTENTVSNSNMNDAKALVFL